MKATKRSRCDRGKPQEISCPHCHETWELEEPSKKAAGLQELCILLYPDLPAPWISHFLKEHLTRAERLALFSTCQALSAVVVKHCSGLELQPARLLRNDSKGRQWVFSLAAGCNNIHLHIKNEAVLLDTPAIWEGITQVTLCDVGLSRPTISRLMLGQLAKLQTIHLTVDYQGLIHDKSLDKGALDKLHNIVQAGGLPALRTLGGNYRALCKLAPLVGDRITQLVLVHPQTLDAFTTQWPEVKRVDIESMTGPSCARLMGPLAQQTRLQVLQELLSHPRLKHVKVPESLLTRQRHSSICSMQPPAWDTLEITGTLQAGNLASIPLEGVQRLLLPPQLHYNADGEGEGEEVKAFCAALQSLGPNSTATMKQSPWHACCNTKSSVSSSLPAISLPFYPAVISCMFQKCAGMPGGLVLEGEGELMQISLGAHLPTLNHIPVGIHTLLCSNWRLDQDGCSWIDVLAHIPAHVKHLLLEDCGLTEASWLAVLDHPAPTGLRTVTLASNKFDMSWVPWEGEELISMQALVTSKWPHVTLEVDSSRGQAYKPEPSQHADVYYDDDGVVEVLESESGPDDSDPYSDEFEDEDDPYW